MQAGAASAGDAVCREASAEANGFWRHLAREPPATTVQALRDFARTRIAGFKVAKTVVLTDGLPRNPSGKLLKHKLRAQYGVGTEQGSAVAPKGAGASSA